MLVVLSYLTISCEKQNLNYNATLINYSGLDGCGWMVKMNDGKVYEPINLADFEPNPQVNEPICVSFKIQSSISICMFGETIFINSLEK